MSMELLNPDNRTDFETFCQDMYQENCLERDAYNEPLLTYNQYVEKNRKFLLANYPQVQYNTCIDNEKGI